MKKEYLPLFSLLLLAAGGCTNETMPELSAEKDGIVIRLSCTDIQTRTQEAGVGRENYVETLQLFVYASETNTSSPLYASGLINVSTVAAPYVQTLSINDDLGGDPDVVNEAIVFAVANYPAAISTASSLSDLKALALNESTSATFLSDGATRVADDPTFVMVAEGAFEQGTGDDAGKAVADLPLKRLAAKISLELAFSDPIVTHGTDDFFGSSLATTTTTWLPMLSGKNARCYLVNARGDAILDGASDIPSYPVSSSFFTYEEETYVAGSGFAPFYTYPVDLTPVKPDDAPYIKLILPWRYTTTIRQDGQDVVIDQNIVELYYKIMLPPDITSFDANTFYKLAVTMSMLGGEANRPTSIVAEGLTIQDWNRLFNDGGGSGDDELAGISFVDANFILLSPDRSVVVQPDPARIEYTVAVGKGVAMDIPFMATEEVEMTVKSISFTQLTAGDKNNPSADDGEKQVVVVEDGAIKTTSFGSGSLCKESWRTASSDHYALKWVTVENNEHNQGGYIRLNHVLSADYNDDDFAITPYTYVLELKLKTREEKAEVTIVQQPVLLFGQVRSSGIAGNVIVKKVSNSISGSYQYAAVLCDNNVYYYTGVPRIYGESSSSSTQYMNPLITDSNKGKSLAVVARPTRAMSATVASKYMYLVEVAPFEGAYITDRLLEEIDKNSDLGKILTKSGTDGGTDTVPITDYYNGVSNGTAARNTYIGGPNSTDNCIIKSTATSGSNRYNTSYVSQINYRAPALAKTDGANDLARSFIAPRFIVASGYGLSAGILSFGQAFLRCATYQEDGYPAGRWRLPTEKEIEYLQTLSAMNYLPSLLNGSYWASSGRRYTGTGFSTVDTNGYGSARCIYDVWYWGDNPVLTPNNQGVYTYTIKTAK